MYNNIFASWAFESFTNSIEVNRNTGNEETNIFDSYIYGAYENLWYIMEMERNTASEKINNICNIGYSGYKNFTSFIELERNVGREEAYFFDNICSSIFYDVTNSVGLGCNISSDYISLFVKAAKGVFKSLFTYEHYMPNNKPDLSTNQSEFSVLHLLLMLLSPTLSSFMFNYLIESLRPLYELLYIPPFVTADANYEFGEPYMLYGNWTIQRIFHRTVWVNDPIAGLYNHGQLCFWFRYLNIQFDWGLDRGGWDVFFIDLRLGDLILTYFGLDLDAFFGQDIGDYFRTINLCWIRIVY